VSKDRSGVGTRTYKVEADNVVVALLGVELDSETTRVAALIRKLTTESDGGESDEDGRLLTDVGEKVGFLVRRISLVGVTVRYVVPCLINSQVVILDVKRRGKIDL